MNAHDFKLRNNAILLVVVMFLYYFLSPVVLSDYAGQEIGRYFGLELQSPGIFVLAATVSFLVFFILMRRYNSYLGATLHSKDVAVIRIIFHLSLWVLMWSFVYLLYTYAVQPPIDRSEAFHRLIPYRHSAFISAISSLFLVSAFALFYQGGGKRYIYIAFLVLVLPEILYGSRVSLLRFLLLIFLIERISFKSVVIGALFIAVFVFSRASLGYGYGDVYSIISIMFGDPLNIFYGIVNLQYLSNIDFSCGVDGLHFTRILIPPVFGLRDFLNAYIGDVTICINKSGFGAGLPDGLGGSPANDLLVSPLSFLTSTIFFISVSLMIFYSKALPIILKYVYIILLVSCLPFFMRNGWIAGINHTLTVFIWILTPLFFLLLLQSNIVRGKI